MGISKFLTSLKRLRARFYRLLIQPRQADIVARNRELVLNVLLTGTTTIFLLLSLALTNSYVVEGHHYVGGRLLLCLAVALFAIGLRYLVYRGAYLLPASLLTGSYGVLGVLFTLQWGVNLPFTLLLFSFVIVLAGILLRAIYAVYGAILIVLFLCFSKYAQQQNVFAPNETWLAHASSFGDVAGSSILFLIIGLVSWLFGRQNEQSFRHITAVETALLREQTLLETKIKERTLDLRRAQLEEMQQLYRFAELGQLSTSLLHDLANHLTTLTLDIEHLQAKKRSGALARARKSIQYLDTMVEQVRGRIRNNTHREEFDIVTNISEVVRLLQAKAQAENVEVIWQPPRRSSSYMVHGDPLKLSQVVAVLTNNAIEAYEQSPETNDRQKRHVEITLQSDSQHITLTVTDYGKGIPPEQRKQLFKPFMSTKRSGMGVGLFIARTMLRQHFKASITINRRLKHTQFIIKLPRYA